MALYTLSNFPPSIIISTPPPGMPSLSSICSSMLMVGYPSRKSARTIGGPWRAALLDSMVKGYISNTLHPTKYFDSLEQSERGAMSFLLAQAFTHLAAVQCLGARYLVHVQYLEKRPKWTISTAKMGLKKPASTKSRPDFIGRIKSGNYMVFETKGRTGSITKALKDKALGQASKISLVNGIAPLASVASCFTFARGAAISGELIDPPSPPRSWNLAFSDAAAACKAYAFFLDGEVSAALQNDRRGISYITLTNGAQYGIETNVLNVLREMKENIRRDSSDQKLLDALSKNEDEPSDLRREGLVAPYGVYADLRRYRVVEIPNPES